LSQSATLTGIWFWSVNGDPFPDAGAIYLISGSSQVANTSVTFPGGTATSSAWVKGTTGAGTVLSAGTAYKAVVHGSGGASGWYSATGSYWSSGAGGSGITSGIITAPSNGAATGGGQDTFVSGVSLAYPTTAFNATNYWVDVEVQATAAAPPPPQYLIAGRTSRLAETYRMTR